MESYLQLLPNDLHNIIDRYVKDDLKLEITEEVLNENGVEITNTILTVTSGRIKIILKSRAGYNFGYYKETFLKEIEKSGDMSSTLVFSSIAIKFKREKGSGSFILSAGGGSDALHVEIPESYKATIVDYLNCVGKNIRIRGPNGPTGAPGIMPPIA